MLGSPSTARRSALLGFFIFSYFPRAPALLVQLRVVPHVHNVLPSTGMQKKNTCACALPHTLQY